ncbi:MAG TPA: hypothetical protein VFT39_24355 [Vicinamibacterales bacterium]|nr:hypothetical protein [Vicinamibacterales bacterium]
MPGFEPRAERGEVLFRNAAHARDRIIVGIRRHVAVHLEPILEIRAVQGQMSGEVRVLNAWQTAVLRGRSAAGIVQ